MTASVGQPPNLISDRTIDRACENDNPFDLPQTLHRMLILHRLCNRANSILDPDRGYISSHPNGQDDLSQTKLEEEFLSLEANLGETHSGMSKCFYFNNLPDK